MKPEEAIQMVQQKFPFEGYMQLGEDTYIRIAQTAIRHLQPGAKVLDFGSGPCDKTAVLQMLGFECSACDDLQDDWHKKDQNRNKIIAFARDAGIDFTVLTGDSLPYEKSSFDMLMLHDVLEHLHDAPRSLLNNLLELVKPHGYLFVTVPNAVNIRKRVKVLLGQTNLPAFEFYYWYPDPWRGHIREYTKGDLEKLCQFLNLDVLELRCVDHLVKTKLPAGAWPFYAAVTSIVPGTKNSWSLVAKKRDEWKPNHSLPEGDLGNILGKATTFHY